MSEAKQHPEMHEGGSAFDRFRDAVKVIVSVPKAIALKAKRKSVKKR